MKFRVSNKVSGQDLGIFDWTDERDALDAMAQDAGYYDFADSCGEVGGADEFVVTKAAARYRVQTRNAAGQWTTEGVANDDEAATFETSEQAEQAIAELRELGESWASASYRVTEVEP